MALSAMLESVGGTSEDVKVIVCMTALGFSALFVGLYSAVDIYLTSFGASNSQRDAETTGTSVRKFFLIAITTASFARVISVVVLAVYYYNEANMGAENAVYPRAIELLRFLPTCVYVSVYTMITVYFAQMCYTVSVNSVSFSQLRSMFFVGNVLTYCFVIFFVTTYPMESIVKWVFLISYAVNFIFTLFYGYSLFNLLPGSTAHHQRTARRVMARFLPLLFICLSGLFFGTVYYTSQVLGLLPTDAGASKQFEVDFLAFTFSEVLPSLLIILLLSKKSTNAPAVAGENTGLVVESSGDLMHNIKSYIAGKYSSIPSAETTPTVSRV